MTSWDTTEFLDTHVCINNRHWQSSEIIIFLCKYDIVISDVLVGCFLDVLFLMLATISGLHDKPRRNKDWVTEKRAKKNLCERHHFFWLHALLSMAFSVAFFVFSLLSPNWLICWMAPIKIHNTAMVGILCDDTMRERSKIWQSLPV